MFRGTPKDLAVAQAVQSGTTQNVLVGPSLPLLSPGYGIFVENPYECLPKPTAFSTTGFLPLTGRRAMCNNHSSRSDETGNCIAQCEQPDLPGKSSRIPFGPPPEIVLSHGHFVTSHRMPSHAVAMSWGVRTPALSSFIFSFNPALVLRNKTI